MPVERLPDNNAFSYMNHLVVWGDDYVSYYGKCSDTEQEDNLGSANLADSSSFCSGDSSLLLSSIDPLLPVLHNSSYDTAYHERRPIKQEACSGLEGWRSRPARDWEPMDVLGWMAQVAREGGVDPLELGLHSVGAAGICGRTLLAMREDDFVRLDPLYGRQLYQRRLELDNGTQTHQQAEDSLMHYENLMSAHQYHYGLEEHKDLVSASNHLTNDMLTLTDLDCQKTSFLHAGAAITDAGSCSSHYAGSDRESDSADSGIDTDVARRPPEKKRPGRPRGSRKKEKQEKLGRLWEFIRDLLKKPEYCPSLICWDNYEEGTFRFVESSKVAKLWGTKKQNPDMNYEKLSRAMRYYYKSKVLQPVIGRRLVYKFGPTATGWRTDDPNFRLRR